MEIAEKGIELVAILLTLAFDLLMIAFPFLLLYVIYRVIKGLMTHNAKLKSQYSNNPTKDPKDRWTSGQ